MKYDWGTMMPIQKGPVIQHRDHYYFSPLEALLLLSLVDFVDLYDHTSLDRTMGEVAPCSSQVNKLS
jgi:hypothetical protein